MTHPIPQNWLNLQEERAKDPIYQKLFEEPRKKREKEEYETRIKSPLQSKITNKNFVIGALSISLLSSSLLFGGLAYNNKIEVEKYQEYLPKNIELRDINNDGLNDLVYKTGKIYLQTKEGNFIPYENKLEEKVK